MEEPITVKRDDLGGQSAGKKFEFVSVKYDREEMLQRLERARVLSDRIFKESGYSMSSNSSTNRAGTTRVHSVGEA